jgi:predicted nucleotidyltransferase
MKSHLPADVVRTLRAWAAAQQEIMRVHVFGSRVRGVSKRGNPVRSDSDLDIAIELSPDVPNPAVHWIENSDYWRATLAMILPYPVDLDLLERNFPIVRKYVDIAGAVVFDRNSQEAKRGAPKPHAPGIGPARNSRLR